MIWGKKWVFFSDMLKLIFHKNRSSAPRLSENWVNKIEVAVFESEIKMASSQYPSKEAAGNFEVAQKIQLPFFLYDIKEWIILAPKQEAAGVLLFVLLMLHWLMLKDVLKYKLLIETFGKKKMHKVARIIHTSNISFDISIPIKMLKFKKLVLTKWI